MRTWIKIALGATWALTSCGRTALAADPEPTFSPVQVAEDIDVFRREFLAADISYSTKARAEAETRLKTLNGGERNQGTFSLEICRIVALADNAHSECRLPAVPRTPIQFMPIDGAYYVIGIEPRSSSLLGAQLLAIDDQPIKKIAEAGLRLHGGLPSAKEFALADTLRSPMRLYSLGFSATIRGVTYRFMSRTGAMLEQRFTVTDAMPDLAWLTPPDRAPWSQQNPDEDFRWMDAPAMDAIVVQLRRNSDAPNQKIVDFLQDAEANRAKLSRRNVVLDMRYNSGGDLMSTRGFLVQWPSRIASDGNLYVLEGPRTFSAGISSVGYLKQAGGKRVVLVGQPPGDRMMFFAETKEVKLPNSGITVIASRQRHDYKDGCRKFDDCFAGIAQSGMPIAVKDLDPDVSVRVTLKDFTDGRDAAMEAVAKEIADRRK